MQTTKISALFVLAITLFFSAPVTAADQHWGDFKKDHCTATGTRQYSAVLWDIPWGKSWEEACAQMGATINGRAVAKPTRCKNTGQMWGEFEVPDDSCPHWGDWRKEHCVGFTQAIGDNAFGFRQYSAILWDIPAGESWVNACAKEPAALTIDGVALPLRSPHVCTTTDAAGIVVSVTTGVLIAATVAAAIVTGGPGGAIGPALAPLVIPLANEAGKRAPLSLWGSVFVPDGTCNLTNSTAIPLTSETAPLLAPPTTK